MINRFLFDLIQEGLAKFAANPPLFTLLFGQYLSLGNKEVAAIQATFAKKPVRVQLGFPHADIKPPLVAIIMQAQSQTDKFLGDAGYLPAFGGTMGGIGCGSGWQHSYQIMVYSENFDFTSYIYEVVKAIIMTSHLAIAKAGIHQPSLTGQDIAPDSRYTPENLFVRSLGFTAFETYVLPEIFGEAYAGAVTSGLSLPPGTLRVSEPYQSGVQVIVPEDTPGD